MTMKPTQSQWYLNCNRTWLSLKSNTTINSSLINSTNTTPVWNLETTTPPGNLSTTIDIEVIVSAIFGMVMVIIMYATVFNLLGCKGSSYHDTYTEGAEHVALTLFTYALYLFDTLSDILLLIQYVAIGQISNFLLVAALTLAPVLFLEFMYVANCHDKWTCGYEAPSGLQKLSFKILGLVLVLMITPLAAFIPTIIYAQVLATGKDNSRNKCKKEENKTGKNDKELADNENGRDDKTKGDNEQAKHEILNLKDDYRLDPIENDNCLKGNKDNNEIGKDKGGKGNKDKGPDIESKKNENADDITENNGKGKDEVVQGQHDKSKDNKSVSFEYFASYLTLVEATLESAPQLILQIYLSITDTYTDINSTRVIRYLSIVGSSIILAWSLTAFSHQNRKTNENQDDRCFVKFIHWISRIAEIVPRIILIALITAEYSGYVMLFILYRLLFAVIYTACEIMRDREDDFTFDLSNLPYILLGIIGNIFCFSELTVLYKWQDKDGCAVKFFAGYYILFYAENGGLLYLWYSDNPVLHQIKIGGACSNHEWFSQYVFVVVIFGFLLQPLFLYLYYNLRNRNDDYCTLQSFLCLCYQLRNGKDNYRTLPSSSSNIESETAC